MENLSHSKSRNQDKWSIAQLQDALDSNRELSVLCTSPLLMLLVLTNLSVSGDRKVHCAALAARIGGGALS